MSNLKNITLPDTITSIGDFAFTYCSSLKSITIPGESTVEIRVEVPKTDEEDKVVKDENGKIVMETVTDTKTLGGVTYIGDSAFELCTSIENITLPKNLKSLGNRAFALCTALENVTFKGDGKFTNDKSEEAVMTVGDYTFFYCDKLLAVTVPTEFAVTFGENAFKDASIKADAIEKVDMKEEKPTEAPDNTATDTATDTATEAPSETATEAPTEQPKEEEKPNNVKTVIALVILGLCIVGICVGGVLLARSNKKLGDKSAPVRKKDDSKRK